MSSGNPKELNDAEKSSTQLNTKYIVVNKNTIHNPPPHFVDLSRKLLCIEYPGIVDNVDKMIETLGGMHMIEMAVGNYNRRLELRFRSGDIFSKPCWGDKDFNSGLLMKITVRQPKRNSDIPSSSKNIEADVEHLTTYRYQLIGVTTMTFKFSRLCDFQYLPLLSTKKWENSNSECRSIYENIMPSHLPDFKWFQSNESFSMPLFFPPPIFAKFNTSKDNKLFYERYKYYEKVIPEVAERLKKDSQKKKYELSNVLDKSRSSRKANSLFTNFNCKDVTIPPGPTAGALDAIKKRGLEHGSLERILELFEERPIWSKSALLHKSDVRNDRLKVILPAVAYYCPNGPWRVMWCKFGYDPRKDSTSRIYQTFDFRVRASDGLKVKVQAKRSYSSNLMHYRAGPLTTERFSLKDCSVQQKIKPKVPVDETFYTLKPNMLPPARQMFYQYCDVQLPEIQDMLARLPQITTDTKYHHKNGWLPTGFNSHCREIVNKCITIQVQKLLIEEKKKRDETQFTLSSQRTAGKFDAPALISEQNPFNIIEDPIIIDSDDEDDVYLKKSGLIMDRDDVHESLEGEDYVDGNDEITDSDDDQERVEGDDDDIDLEAVDEINKIIGNISEPETQTEESYEEQEDSEEEFDPELVSLYKKLIVSNSENDKNVCDK